MAARSREKEPLDLVHQNQIFCETVRKELRCQKLHTEYGVNPLKRVHTITRKPMSWHDNIEEPADAQGGDDAEWSDGVYDEGKSDGGVEKVNLSTTWECLQQQQIKELMHSPVKVSQNQLAKNCPYNVKNLVVLHN
ncbi:protein FAM183A isoform X2 [Gopherus flavomarginatus]|uniref:protein FAM183A isoform X2 n=1 Tax=Gopherus flavomarginatus TaxID=286002 RepID=UPI0021CBF8E6|nr:protein FAM183A isoform X2 [Gopherus flavomarginatus]